MLKGNKMKNVFKLILSGLILFGSVPTLSAMDSSNGMEEIKKKKKKKSKKVKGKEGKGKKGSKWGSWKSKWKKKKNN
jgi:hypothetical protein